MVSGGTVSVLLLVWGLLFLGGMYALASRMLSPVADDEVPPGDGEDWAGGSVSSR